MKGVNIHPLLLQQRCRWLSFSLLSPLYLESFLLPSDLRTGPPTTTAQLCLGGLIKTRTASGFRNQDSVCSKCCWRTSAAVRGPPTAASPSLAGSLRVVSLVEFGLSPALTAIKTSAINCDIVTRQVVGDKLKLSPKRVLIFD